MRQRRPLAAILAAALAVPLMGFVATAAGEAEPAQTASLRDPVKREIAMQLIASAENSVLDWYNRYGYIEDIGDERGYTAGIVGFTSGTHDMLMLVEHYTEQEPDNALADYLPALRAVDGTDSHEGLGPDFEATWEEEGQNPAFQAAQRHEVDRLYFGPAVGTAEEDGLGALGQFAYFDAIVMHGDTGFESIRADALDDAATPADGGDETTYLHAFLDARVVEMKKEVAHEDTSRVDTAQRVFLDDGNLELATPLSWAVYGDPFEILTDPEPRWESTVDEDTLISQDRPVTTSSVEGSSFVGGKAIDGDGTTRWASTEGVDPQWIQVDLGAGATVDRVALTWEVAYASEYRVEISDDGSTWTRLATETSGDGGTDEWADLAGAGRYLRIYGTSRGTEYGYSLWELEVYGTPGDDSGDNPGGGEFTVVAAGDIAAQCDESDSGCAHFATASRAEAIDPAFYLTLGDNQYDDAHIEDFRNYYDKSWGRFKDRTHPTPGNHESYDDWENRDEKAYREYFGDRATPEGKMWYSFDRGNWHFIALNSNRFDESEQMDWLDADLAANTKPCTVAYFHHPMFSSGEHGNAPVSRPVWEKLEAADTELVLSGHDHHYERFAPQTTDGEASPDGIVEIIGGTGGGSLYSSGTIQENSLETIFDEYGVLQLDFTDSTFTSKFVSVDGDVLDTSPAYTCH